MHEPTKLVRMQEKRTDSYSLLTPIPYSFLGVADRKDDVRTCRSYHFVVAGWKTKKVESCGHENDNSRVNQFNEPLALPVAP